MFNNIDFKIKNDLLGRCDNGYRKKPLTEILVTKNNNFPKQTNACRQIISNNQEISKYRGRDGRFDFHRHHRPDQSHRQL